MEFIATVWEKNVFGFCGEMEHSAIALTAEAAERIFCAGMKIFKGDAESVTALKVTFADGVCVCIYREIKDIENGVYRVRTWTRSNSYDETTMSKAALKKQVLAKITAEFSEPTEQSA